jgi:hypothetical protein
MLARLIRNYLCDSNFSLHYILENLSRRPYDCAISCVPQHIGGSDILHNHRLRNFGFVRRHNYIILGTPASRLMPFTFYFFRAGGADGAIARRWSVAKRRATPGNREEGNQALLRNSIYVTTEAKPLDCGREASAFSLQKKKAAAKGAFALQNTLRTRT